MSELILSPEGAHLVEQDPKFQSLLDEFSQPKAAEISAASYRHSLLGGGRQARVFEVEGFSMAEKATRRPISRKQNQDGVQTSFLRALRAREFWTNNRPLDSRLYVPVYYAAVEHPDSTGAVLLDKVGEGTTVSRLMPDWDWSESYELEVAAREVNEEVLAVAEQIVGLFQIEDSFFLQLFEAGGGGNEAHEANAVVDYQPRNGGLDSLRFGVVDL